MNNVFNYQSAEAPDPIRIVQAIGGEKEGGGLVVDPGFDAPESTAVGKYDTLRYAVIKAYRLVAAVGASDTTIKIAKGSGIVVGEFLGYGKLAVACTAIDQTNTDYDTITVTMGVVIAAGEVLYQAKAASASAAVPIYAPAFLTKNLTSSGVGDVPMALFSIGSVRKETACIGVDIAGMLATIKLV